MSEPTFHPFADRILVEPSVPENKTKGGILLPDTGEKDKPSEGKVITVGPGKRVDGKIQEMQVKPGQKVLFGKYAGSTIKLGDKDYLVMREDDILGVVEA
jgi:chaperonin GroES